MNWSWKTGMKLAKEQCKLQIVLNKSKTVYSNNCDTKLWVPGIWMCLHIVLHEYWIPEASHLLWWMRYWWERGFEMFGTIQFQIFHTAIHAFLTAKLLLTFAWNDYMAYRVHIAFELMSFVAKITRSMRWSFISKRPKMCSFRVQSVHLNCKRWNQLVVKSNKSLNHLNFGKYRV